MLDIYGGLRHPLESSAGGRRGSRLAGWSDADSRLVEVGPEVPGEFDEALEILDEAGAAAEGEVLTLVWAAVATTHIAARAGDLEAAHRAAEQATEQAPHTLAPWATAAARRSTAAVLSIDGDWDEALRTWRTALDDVASVGDIGGIVLTLRTAAAAAEARGETDLAEGLWQVIPTASGDSTLVPLFADAEDRLRDRLGQPAATDITSSVRQGRELLTHAVAAGPVPGGEAPVAPAAMAGLMRFGPFEVDLDAHELRRDGERVHTEPQVFDVLVHLMRNAGRVVSRDELMDEVWGDRFVSPSAVSSRIKSARSATDDDGKAQKVIRTLHGKGFMFVAELG